jgi:predicted O-methyltransferase YrrM
MSIDFNKAKQFTDKLESIVGYGTEDFSIFLYSLIKMRKPKNIVEFGTGVGSVMLWSALACKENGFGKITTIDNGLHWNKEIQHFDNEIFKNKTYNDFIKEIINEYEVNDFVLFKNEDIVISIMNSIKDKIDILFFDFDHSPLSIHNFISNSLDKMSDQSIIFIDSASTYYPSYLFLESIINEINLNNIPFSLNLNEESISFVKRSSFTLTHIIENKSRHQNSTAMIEIKPKDCFPNSNFIRF